MKRLINILNKLFTFDCEKQQQTNNNFINYNNTIMGI